MPKLVKTEINGRIYQVCSDCGAFVSNPRCLACTQLNTSDKFLIDELKPYYLEVVYKRPLPSFMIHHILEYFFSRDTLIAHNRYYNVSDRELIRVRGRDHHRKIRGYKLHGAELADERLLDSEDGVNELLSRIPEEIVAIFSAK